MNLEHETALVRSFILPVRKARYLGFLKTPKNRVKFRDALAHFRDLDPRYAHLIPSSHHSRKDVEATLRSKGAPGLCYVMSEWREIDGRTMPLTEALTQVVGRGMGTFLSCVPGLLAYFESEEAGDRYILERKAAELQH